MTIKIKIHFLALLLILITGTFAHSEAIAAAKRSDFNDYGYALNLWKTARDRAAFEAEYDRLRIDENAEMIKEWAKSFKEDPEGTEERLKGDPNEELVRQISDFSTLYAVWIDVMKAWRVAADRQGNGLNDLWGSIYCWSAATENIFTKDCNDIPDWRTPEQRARDERMISKRRKALQAIDSWRPGPNGG